MLRTSPRSPGSGPRHLAWHPGGTLYVVNELSSAVSVLSWDAALGRLSDAGSVPQDSNG